MRVGIKFIACVVALLFTGCSRDAVHIGVPYNYVLPFSSFQVYTTYQSEVYVDGVHYGTTSSGVFTQDDGKVATYITGKFTPSKSDVGWSFYGRSNYDEVVRGFLQCNGKSVANTIPLLPYVLSADQYVNIYVTELECPYIVEPVPDSVLAYGFTLEYSDTAASLSPPDPISVEGVTAVYLGYGLIE